MQVFNISSLVAVSEATNQAWLEFLRIPSLSMGLYRLKAGQADLQQLHTEDEVYFVVSGRGFFRTGEQQQAVETGTLIFVERSVEHRFYDVTDDLTVLVFFAPPENSLKVAAKK
jgi:mannose-6-phosphate isomerase-like protein (cupin superfamily)